VTPEATSAGRQVYPRPQNVQHSSPRGKTIAGGVEPVCWTFLDATVGSEELHDVGYRRVGVLEYFAGALGFLVGDGQSADGFAAVADLVPIVLVVNGFAVLDTFQPGIDSLGSDGVLMVARSAGEGVE